MSNNWWGKVFLYIQRVMSKGEEYGMCKAIDVANTFIEIGKDKPIPVSNMKLQKLLYYAQGWYLALTGKPLFNESLYKWDFGPVCPEIYEEFKEYKGEFIFNTSCSGNIITEQRIRYFLEIIWKMYGKHSGMELSKLSHKESPWLTTKMYEVISIDKIKQCFVEMKAIFEEKKECSVSE